MSDIHPAPTGAEQVHAAPAMPAPTPQPNPIDGSVPGQADTIIPGTSFKSQDDLVNSYKELQAELTRLKQQPQKQEETPTEPEPEPTDAEPEPTDNTPQFDWSRPVNELYDAEKGEFDKDFISVMDKAGVPKEALESHFATLNQLMSVAQQYYREKAESLVGGKENWEAVQQYIAQNMPQVAGDLNDPGKYEFVIEAAVARMRKEGGMVDSGEPSAAPNSVPTAVTHQPYLLPNSPETTRAMADPRFRTDPEYQREVRERVRRGAEIAARQR